MAYIQFPNPTPVFPALVPLAWPIHKKPIMASRVTTAVSGRETQLACAVFPRWEFTLTYGGESWLRDQTQNITPGPNAIGFTELQQLSGLFLACLGSYGEFYYNDPDDNSRSGEAVGTSNGVQTTFPLFVSWGSGPFTPAFTMPVGGIAAIDAVYINDVVVSPSDYTLDSTKTQLVFTSAPSAGTITSDFHFYFRCRFLEDEMTYSQWAENLWEVKQVQFESVKP